MSDKTLLSKHLTEDDFVSIGEAITTGYSACDSFMQSNVVSENFLPLMDLRSRLITPFVEYSLSKLDSFQFEFKQNDAKNCWHIRLHRGNLTLTTHFLGRNADRKIPRKALNRAVLAGKNFDLFEDLESTNDSEDNNSYCWIMHAGFIKPKFASLAVPTSDQKSIHGKAIELPLINANLTKVEEIREEMTFKLLSTQEQNETING